MRTWLFVPGHDAHKAQKALRSGADVVIVDWEDAVPPERKPEARATTRSILAQGSYAVASPLTPQPPLPHGGEGEKPLIQGSPPPRCVVRVNSRNDPAFADDLAMLAELPVSGVLLPKAAGPDDVIDLAGAIGLPIIPIIESALGVESAFAIAKAHPQVERLAFGSLDLLADLGVQWAPQDPASQYARARVVIAGRAAGLAGPIDTVYPQLNDDDGLRRDAAAARALGFAGKFLLHPAQIGVVRDVFAPTPDEIRRATEIIQAFQEARSRGESAVRVGGTFIDPPVVRWAEHILSMHAADAP